MQDIEYLKSMYPSGIKILQGYVSEACDRLDYKNSPMYDEYPDHLMVNRLCDTICDTVMSSEGAERVTSMWNIAETDRSSLEMEELHNDMKRLDIDSSVDNPDADQDEMIPEECFQIEVESVRKNQGMQYMDKQEANEVTPDPAQGRGESTIRSVEERIETQEIRGRNPMGPGPERPPMGPGPGLSLIHISRRSVAFWTRLAILRLTVFHKRFPLTNSKVMLLPANISAFWLIRKNAGSSPCS